MADTGFRGDLRDAISAGTVLLVVVVGVAGTLVGSSRTRDRVPAGKHEADSDAAV